MRWGSYERGKKTHCFEALWTEKGASPFPAGWRAEKAQKTMRVCPKAQKPKANFFFCGTVLLLFTYYTTVYRHERSLPLSIHFSTVFLRCRRYYSSTVGSFRVISGEIVPAVTFPLLPDFE